ncbi:unnamed protein product [Lampetra fluviatilis]
MYGREQELHIEAQPGKASKTRRDVAVPLQVTLQWLLEARAAAKENATKTQFAHEENVGRRKHVLPWAVEERVILYCSQVPLRTAPKLHRPWRGLL